MTIRNIIETKDLTKIYKLKGGGKQIKALDRINISIKEGEIFGLLGPNGAGKTTLIQILTTLLQPTSGYAIIDGYNILKKPLRAKAKVSLMLESNMLYYRITAYDNLKFFCKIYNVPNYKQKIIEIAKEFELEGWLNQYVEKFSSGMKMKLALMRTLILERDILFLDEPTLGLDVKSVDFIVKKIKNTTKTIFLTSHDMSVIEKLCDRIAFLNNGKIIKIGTQSEIQSLMRSDIKVKVEILGDKAKLIKDLDTCDYVKEYKEEKKGIVISIKRRDNYNDLLLTLKNHKISKIKEQDFSLEELFLQLI